MHVCYSLLGLFQKRFKDLNVTLKAYKELNIKIQQDSKNIEEQLQSLDREGESFEREKEEWRRNLEQARKDITDQNDRLTLLSQQLSGERVGTKPQSYNTM